MNVLERIDQQVKNNPVIIFMKGTPQFPMCGFSTRAATALAECGVPFAHVNVLQDPEIFENLPKYTDWPTFPQIYVDGELIGGCDITLELHAGGELKTMLEKAVAQEGSEGGLRGCLKSRLGMTRGSLPVCAGGEAGVDSVWDS